LIFLPFALKVPPIYIIFEQWSDLLCSQWPPLCQNFIGGHLWTIWHLRWSGGDEVGATGGHVDQQLEDDDGHYVDFQWAEKSDKCPY